MRNLRRTMTVAGLVMVLLLATVAGALAAETDEAEGLDLDALRAGVVEDIDARIEI